MTFIDSQYYIMAPCQGAVYYGPFSDSTVACEWAKKQNFAYSFRVRDGQYMTYLIRGRKQVTADPNPNYEYAIVNPNPSEYQDITENIEYLESQIKAGYAVDITPAILNANTNQDCLHITDNTTLAYGQCIAIAIRKGKAQPEFYYLPAIQHSSVKALAKRLNVTVF